MRKHIKIARASDFCGPFEVDYAKVLLYKAVLRSYRQVTCVSKQWFHIVGAEVTVKQTLKKSVKMSNFILQVFQFWDIVQTKMT